MDQGWKLGDTVWIYLPGCDGRQSGKIVHIFELPDWQPGTKHYVIELETEMDPLLEVRQMMWHAEK